MTCQCFYKLRLTTIFLYLILFCQIQKEAFAQEKICGRALTKVLAKLCVNRFNNRIKRSVEEKILPSGESWYYGPKNVVRKSEPQINKNKIEIFKTNHVESTEDKILIRKRKRKQVYIVTSKGVADECCSQPCVYEDIIKYCA